VLGHFVEAIARGAAKLDVSAGTKPIAMQLEVPGRGGARAGSVRLGVPICYELLFPELIRHFVVDGAELLVAITNDAWYGRTGAPDQFLALTAMRAAENGVAVVRAANTGFSAIIDARGRIRDRSELFERGYRVADVRLGGGSGASGASFQARHGDVFVRGCWMGVALVAGVGLRAQYRSRRKPIGNGTVSRTSNQGATGEDPVEAGES
jgi:apolipoprotein N-acyltransferase